MKKTIKFIIPMLLLFLFTACSNKSIEKSNKYDSLTSSERTVVDKIFESYDTWKYFEASLTCKEIGFLKTTNDEITFIVNYENPTHEKLGDGVYSKNPSLHRYFSVNKKTGELSEIATKKTVSPGVLTAFPFDSDAQEMKEIIATAYKKMMPALG